MREPPWQQNRQIGIPRACTDQARREVKNRRSVGAAACELDHAAAAGGRPGWRLNARCIAGWQDPSIPRQKFRWLTLPVYAVTDFGQVVGDRIQDLIGGLWPRLR